MILGKKDRSIGNFSPKKVKALIDSLKRLVQNHQEGVMNLDRCMKQKAESFLALAYPIALAQIVLTTFPIFFMPLECIATCRDRSVYRVLL